MSDSYKVPDYIKKVIHNERVEAAAWLAERGETPLTVDGIANALRHLGRSTFRRIQEGNFDAAIDAAFALGFGRCGVRANVLIAVHAAACGLPVERAIMDDREYAFSHAAKAIGKWTVGGVAPGAVIVKGSMGGPEFSIPAYPDGFVHDWFGPQIVPSRVVVRGPMPVGRIIIELEEGDHGQGDHLSFAVPEIMRGSAKTFEANDPECVAPIRSVAFISDARRAGRAVIGPVAMGGFKADLQPGDRVVFNGVEAPLAKPWPFEPGEVVTVTAKHSTKPKEPGNVIAVPCTREGCGHVTKYPTGEAPDTQLECPHAFTFDVRRGRMGHFVCRCGVSVPAEQIYDAGKQPAARYDHAGNTLADSAQRVHDENRALLVENAQLRRSLEELVRVTKRKGTK